MRFDFIERRSAFYIIAATFIIGSIIAVLTLPLRLGIDMTGGVQIEYRYSKPVSLDTIHTIVDSRIATLTHNGTAITNTSSVYAITGDDLFVVEIGFERGAMPETDFENLKTQFRDSLTAAINESTKGAIHLEKYVNIGESFGDYIKRTAYLTLAIVVFAISCYIAYAFRGSIEGVSSFSFAIVTAVSLIHDVVITFGLYIIASAIFPEFRFDTFFITALLTVLGYSINDTIVIMDRIRSNLKLPEFKKVTFSKLINASLHETLTRSIYTPLTILIVLVALFAFGPESLKGFVLTLIFGTVVGTYSSIFVAAPLLYDIQRQKKA